MEIVLEPVRVNHEEFYGLEHRESRSNDEEDRSNDTEQCFFEMSSDALFDPEDEVVELSALSVIPEGVEPSVKELPHCD